MKLHIYGDNIVECERGLYLIANAIGASSVLLNESESSATNPNYKVVSNQRNIILNIRFFPGFGRWSNDIASIIESRGGVLRESTDIVITKLIPSSDQNFIELILIGIEFCGALAAGNQAWQRCGRAYSFSMSGTPYIYLTDIGGHELDKNRNEKAVRLPNPIVPFAFLTHSLMQKTPAVPVFTPNYAITHQIHGLFEQCYGDETLSQLLDNLITEKSITEPIEKLFKMTSSFVSALSEKRRKHDTFKTVQWVEWINILKKKESSIDFICSQKQPWKKTAYIEGLTTSAKEVIETTSKYAYGIGAKELPICIIPPSQRLNFARYIKSVYTTIPLEFQNWLNNNSALCICWIMGFKPRGDDARPDRGVVPLARMLLGQNLDLLTFVYGPAKSFTWQLLIDNPQELYRRNGLWESILKLSDAVLIDSSTDSVTKKGYLKHHWASKKQRLSPPEFPPTAYLPLTYNENDVDTILHLTLNSNKKHFFECMCNPPGGDWSGITVIADYTTKRLSRWLSLPRVSADGDKRPDHVFQLFPEIGNPIFLIIESKEKRVSLNNEKDIGPRLVSYVKNLLSTPPSVTYENNWGRNLDNQTTSISEYGFASGVAFFHEGLESLADFNIAVDIVFSVQVDDPKATIFIRPLTNLGKRVAVIIQDKYLLPNLISIQQI
ncbi:MAG: hypothetical protein KKH94_09590 [Candidatus Omnitrophica bacterium]|nr:hypothetical protein [Candidatus Omnitrophota bacterium]